MLHVITPMSRIHNYRQLRHAMLPLLHAHQMIWWVIVDGSIGYDPYLHGAFNEHIRFVSSPHVRALAGHAHRNFALDHLKKIHTSGTDWIWFLDDDNTIHEDLPRILDESYSDDVVIFDQLIRRKFVGFLKRVRKADINKVRICSIDMAQCAFRLQALKNIRFREDIYEADGLFIEELKAQNQVRVISKTLCYYNWIR
jgi:hypothetical protein